MKTFIEIKGFSDFEMVHTRCIMISNERHDANELLKIFCCELGIPSHKGLNVSELDSYTILFIEFLMDMGFTKLKTQAVLFTD